ncbi:hypothetical protein [Hyalangium rubrum]|uniref:Glycosyltransferase RgtA/B/C/D-like domain-containing protein n=1 Tax=Hyalangium rubrum TaxID=3103134 RepID=A0ABU5HB61_9BACT|nr:hypothetical protein [Hyalangium sp. s54d21]MDY7230561.1 hypothetical protein [Hyalangium sp. s54d21]
MSSPELRWRMARVLGVSAALLVPLFWVPRIMAGDLLSHVYNAWLSLELKRQPVPGLVTAWQYSNVLVDWVLTGLMEVLGPVWAERLTVAVCVLVFFWGAFAFLAEVSGRAPTHLIPVLAVLAYGWVFHMGFFNFYASLGMCLLALALLRRRSGWARGLALGLGGLAVLAHPHPVLAAVCFAGYRALAERLTPRRRAGLFSLSVVGLAVVPLVLRRLTRTMWDPEQFFNALGVDQAWVFGRAFGWVSLGLLGVWGVWLVRRIREEGGRAFVERPEVQLYALGVVAVVALPTAVVMPDPPVVLSFIAERLSLWVAVVGWAVVGAVVPRRSEVVLVSAVAVLFFGLLLREHRALYRMEKDMGQVLEQLPPGQRVVWVAPLRDERVPALLHLIDRACIGRCYSYANYEPPTRVFRVRATGPNPWVMHRYEDVVAALQGEYVVQAQDAPVWALRACSGGRLVLGGPLREGELARPRCPSERP